MSLFTPWEPTEFLLTEQDVKRECYIAASYHPDVRRFSYDERIFRSVRAETTWIIFLMMHQ